MPQHCIQNRVWCVEQYFRTYGTYRNYGPSLAAVRERFEEHFNLTAPTKKTILSWVRKFRGNGSVTNSNKGNSGRRRTTRSNENVGRVFDKVLQSPKKSTRRISRELGLERTGVIRMLKEIGARSYRIQILHELRPTDFQTRMAFCTRVLAHSYAIPDYVDDWWYTDECHVLLSGHVNKQNTRFLGWEKPDEYMQRPLHSEKVTVWAAISSHGVIGPYFIEDNNENPLTVNGEVYRTQIIERFHADLQTFCILNDIDFEKQIFMQDGATPHTMQDNIRLLQQLFPERLVSRRTNFPYPPRSPDLTICDAFLWGMLKELCFRPTPRSIRQLKDNIERVFRDISAQQCSEMASKIMDRMEYVFTNEGRHVEHVFV